MAAIFGMDQGMSSMVQVPYILLSAHLPAVNSIIKSHFAWNWQSATLNRGDELVCLPLALLQPYAIRLVDSTYSNGRPVGMSREIFGVLGMFWDTKTANADVRLLFFG
jgi:hypothetical protein